MTFAILTAAALAEHAVADLIPSEHPAAIMATASAECVLVDVGDTPLRVFELEEGWVVEGHTHAVSISDVDGVELEELERVDEGVFARPSVKLGKVLTAAGIKDEKTRSLFAHMLSMATDVNDFDDWVQSNPTTSKHLAKLKTKGWGTKALYRVHSGEGAHESVEEGGFFSKDKVGKWSVARRGKSGIGLEGPNGEHLHVSEKHGVFMHHDSGKPGSPGTDFKKSRLPKAVLAAAKKRYAEMNEGLDEGRFGPRSSNDTLGKFWVVFPATPKSELVDILAETTAFNLGDIALGMGRRWGLEGVYKASDKGKAKAHAEKLLAASESVEEMNAVPSHQFDYPVYTTVSMSLSDILMLPKSGEGQLPYETLDAIRVYVDSAPALMAERAALPRRVLARLKKDKRFMKLLDASGVSLKHRTDEALEEAKRTKESAAHAYDVAHAKLEKRLKTMAAKLKKHRSDFERGGSKGWGYVGDLTGYEELLSDNRVLEDADQTPLETTTENPMTTRTHEFAEIHLGEDAVELRLDGSDEVLSSVPCDVEDSEAIAEAEEHLAQSALLEHDMDEVDDGDEDEECVDEAARDAFDVEVIQSVGEALGAVLTSGDHSALMQDIRLFDEAVADGDYESAVARADVIALGLGADELVEFKKLTGARLAKFRKSRKVQTPEEKAKNKVRRRKLARDPGARRKAAKYRKRFKRRLSQSDDEEFDMQESVEHALPEHLEEAYGNTSYEMAYKGKTSSEDAIKHAAMGFFGGTIGHHSAFAGLKGKMETAGYVGLKTASDSDMLRVLGRLTTEGILSYVDGKGFTANAKHEAFGEADED
jgi:hypothetical protein